MCMRDARVCVCGKSVLHAPFSFLSLFRFLPLPKNAAAHLSIDVCRNPHASACMQYVCTCVVYVVCYICECPFPHISQRHILVTNLKRRRLSKQVKMRRARAGEKKRTNKWCENVHISRQRVTLGLASVDTFNWLW